MYLFQIKFSPDPCPGVGFQDHIGSSIFCFFKASILFSVVVVPIYIPTKFPQEGSFFSTPFPAFIVCRLFDVNHSDFSEVIPHYSFDLHLSNNWASLVAQLVMWETWVWSLGWEYPLEKGKAIQPSILARRIPWTSPWGHKESDMTERLSVSNRRWQEWASAL